MGPPGGPVDGVALHGHDAEALAHAPVVAYFHGRQCRALAPGYADPVEEALVDRLRLGRHIAPGGRCHAAVGADDQIRIHRGAMVQAGRRPAVARIHDVRDRMAEMHGHAGIRHGSEECALQIGAQHGQGGLPEGRGSVYRGDVQRA